MIRDPHIPDDARATIYRSRPGAGRLFGGHELDAPPAFMRDEGPRHEPEAARIGFAPALFRRTL